MSEFKRPFIIPIFLPQSGCPHQCAFCNQKAITGVTERMITPAQLTRLIDQFLTYRNDRRDRIQISFYGGNFLGIDIPYMISLLETATGYVRRGQVDSLRFSTRPDTIDEQRLDILKPFPVETVEIGAQSMDDRVLNMSLRGHSASDTCQATALLKQRKYEVGLQMMVGLPGDSRDVSIETAKRMIRLFPDFVRIYPTLVLSGSLLARWYRDGIYRPLTLEGSVGIVKKLYLEFKKQQVRVIRMGLQPSDELSSGTTVLAGPYHPAFGHLVFSELFFDSAVAKLNGVIAPNASLRIYVHPRSISKMRGLKNQNIERLKRIFSLKSIDIRPNTTLDEDMLEIG